MKWRGLKPAYSSDLAKLTGAKRREFSGMIPVSTSNFMIPATPISTHPATLRLARTSNVNPGLINP